ncbi:MAG: hypothetical protein ACXVZL_12480 [Gaiellaceae bacterium]
MSRYPGLAAAVAARMAPHAPEGIELREEPSGFLQARIDENRWETFPLDEPEVEEEIPAEAYDPPYPAFGVLEALDFVQEFVRYELGSGWEGEAWAELGPDAIRFGYGELAFEPVPLSALGSST